MIRLGGNGTGEDPLPDNFDLFVGQLPIRRHLQIRIGVQQGTIQRAGIGVARNNRCTASSADQHRGARIDHQQSI